MVMECYYISKLSGDYGYMKRMRELWIREGRFDITKERLAGQAHSILKKNLLSEDELKEIRRKVIKSAVLFVRGYARGSRL